MGLEGEARERALADIASGVNIHPEAVAAFRVERDAVVDDDGNELEPAYCGTTSTTDPAKVDELNQIMDEHRSNGFTVTDLAIEEGDVT